MDWKHPFGRDHGNRPAATKPDPKAPAADAPGDPAAVPVQPQGHAPTPAADAPALGPTDAPGDHGGPLQPQGEPQAVPSGDALGDLQPGPDFSGWAPRLDAHGLLGLEAPNLPDSDRWWSVAGFDDLPEPGDGCPECGSFETWSDLAGGRRCGVCDRDKLTRALWLADRAARLRRIHPPVARAAKPAPRRPRGCEQTARPDPEHGDGNRPTDGEPGALAGCEAG